MRWAMLVACIALCVAAPAGFCAEAADPFAAWLATIDRGPWTARSLATDAVLLFRPAPPEGAYRRLWVRYELLAPETNQSGFAYRSRVTLSEFDCGAGRARTLETTWYAGSNMAAPSQVSSAPTPWQQPEPDTLFEEELKQACGL